MHRLLNACVAIMCVVKEVTVAITRAPASHTPAFPPISPLFSPVFPIFPHFPAFPPISPISPISSIFPWPKKDLETPGWETSKACMSLSHGGRKYVNGGHHLVQAVRLIRQEHVEMKLKLWMYKFRKKLMRVCLRVRNTHNKFKQGHTTSIICKRVIQCPTHRNLWAVFMTLHNTLVHSTRYLSTCTFGVVNSN